MSDPNNTLPAVEPQDQYSIEDDVETTNTRSYSQGQLVLRRFLRHKAAMVSLIVLVFVVLASGHWGDSATKTPVGLGWLGALGVAILVVGIGASLGGPTGYAINPARDLGPRIAFAVLPIPGKTGADWGYSWVPVVGPLIGGVVAGLASGVLLPA